MQRILVTGGAGFIGANFLHYWINHHRDDEITVLDALTYAGNRSSIEKLLAGDSMTFVHGDVCDDKLVSDILVTRNIDTIIHFAAESHVDRSIHGPDPFIQTNIVGTHTLLKCARDFWLRDRTLAHRHHFHHISTDEVFGSLSTEDEAFHEATPYNPSSPYSASKAASDMLVRAYGATYGMNITISNCSNNYGPFHFPEKLIPLTIINILLGRHIPVYGQGKNVRDWLYVVDHCRGIDLILKRGRPGETYNIGGACEKTNIEVVNLICKTIDEFFQNQPELLNRYPETPVSHDRNSNSLVRFVKDRPGHDLRYAINAAKITSELGFQISESFQDGLQKTIQWYLSNETWWKPLLNNQYKEWLARQYD